MAAVQSATSLSSPLSSVSCWLHYWKVSMWYQWRPLETQDSHPPSFSVTERKHFSHRTGRKSWRGSWLAWLQSLIPETVMTLRERELLMLVSWPALGMKMGSAPSEQERCAVRRKDYGNIYAFVDHRATPCLDLGLGSDPWEVQEDSCF